MGVALGSIPLALRWRFLSCELMIPNGRPLLVITSRLQ
jgi:hypothetical protein